MTLWGQTIRPPILPLSGTGAERRLGRRLFDTNCASCHGGDKWTKSQILHADNPAFFAAAGPPRDPGVANTGTQLQSYTVDPPGGPGPFTINYLEGVGTFDNQNPREIRGAGAAIGTTAAGGLGFNVPSVLGTRYHAPYLHDGSAQNFSQVFARHTLPGGNTIEDELNNAERLALIEFLRSVDGSTNTLPSEADQFKDDIAP
jgi:cytochrome c peroxidase